MTIAEDVDYRTEKIVTKIQQQEKQKPNEGYEQEDGLEEYGDGYANYFSLG